jgi:hypothetical protein
VPPQPGVPLDELDELEVDEPPDELELEEPPDELELDEPPDELDELDEPPDDPEELEVEVEPEPPGEVEVEQPKATCAHANRKRSLFMVIARKSLGALPCRKKSYLHAATFRCPLGHTRSATTQPRVGTSPDEHGSPEHSQLIALGRVQQVHSSWAHDAVVFCSRWTGVQRHLPEAVKQPTRAHAHCAPAAG